MNNENKEKFLKIGITVLSLIVVISIGYAYFSSIVTNTDHEEVSAETATISLKFDDNDNGVSGRLNLGESITKKFTLENTGTKDAYAKINWHNLVNTYTEDSLTYILEQSTSENGTYTELGSGKVPVSNSETTETLKNGILVPTNTTYYYKLTITLNNLDTNQNSDINAEFYSFFGLEEGNENELLTMHIKNLVSSADSSSINVIEAENVSEACTNTLAYDGTVDNNLRYVGPNPCNYVTFNDEVWRIIGVMNNVDDGTGNLEMRIKLIRNSSLGRYVWDTSEINVNSGTGVNDWTQADLMRELNGDYLNTTLTEDTMWFSSDENLKEEIYNHNLGLKSSAQSLIYNAKWYLGGYSTVNATAMEYYSYEKGNKVWGSSTGQTCDDGACPRAISWIGKVALIYPSDYGFAIGEENRTTCLESSLGILSWGNYYCFSSQWLSGLVITPFSDAPNKAFHIGPRGLDNEYDPYRSFELSRKWTIYPSLYLKSSVKVTGGNGSPESPFTLE